MSKAVRASGLISLFTRHNNAANLLMLALVVFGGYALTQLNTQFFPTRDVPRVSVRVVWPGASAQDMEKTVLRSIEPELRFLDGIEEVSSVAREGSAYVSMSVRRGADIKETLAEVKGAMDRVTTLPQDAEKPVIRQVGHYENVARLIVTGPFREKALKAHALDIRDGLLKAGIDRVTLNGARREEILVEIPPRELRRLDLIIGDVVSLIKRNTQDRPSGTLKGAANKNVRALGQPDTVNDIGRIAVIAKPTGEKIRLRDVATIRHSYNESDVLGLHKGNAAIRLDIQRAPSSDMLTIDRLLSQYLEKLRPQLPPGLELVKFDVRADRLQERIGLLLANGAGGLVIVLIILFIFLNARIAFWVAFGIPVAMMAAITFMWLTGQTINSVSLFSLILALGIIVDDAIVVGEHTATRSQMGDPPLKAAERGATRMLAPVIAASATTMVAFIPTFFLTGRVGDTFIALPMVIISVLAASLIECFLILPGHLSHGISVIRRPPSRFRRGFDKFFNAFREKPFRWFVGTAYNWRYTTLALAIAALILAISLISSGRIKFHFFPSPEAEFITASIVMSAGTPREEMVRVIDTVEKTLAKVDRRLGKGYEKIVVTSFVRLGKIGYSTGDNLAQIDVQLTASEVRTVRTRNVVRAWRRAMPDIPGLIRFSIGERRHGPPGRDVDIRLAGNEPFAMKMAAVEIEKLMAGFAGLSAITDDLPYGKQDVLVTLKPRGLAMGFSAENIGMQLRSGLEGVVARRFAQGTEEISVRVKYAQNSGGRQVLRIIQLKNPDGAHVPLTEVVKISEKPGFSLIHRRGGNTTISVTANIDPKITSSIEIQRALELNGLPDIARKYGVDYRFAGRSEERKESFSDLGTGGFLALASIYLILAWVFASYSRPLVIMAIIPFGAVGAILGHYVMGYSLSILSVIGLIGLSGIIVNDSIILVSRVDERLRHGEDMMSAAIGASQDRLRAVLLTSLTTIGGLTPLMFEKSAQAQFLLPMAITVVFGLAVATVLVLIIVPACLGVLDDITHRSRRAVKKEAT